MSRQTPESERHEKLVTNRLDVTTQGIPVATRTRLLNKFKSQHYQSMSQHNPRAILENRLRQKNKKLRQRLRALSRKYFLCCDRETNLG